MPSTVTNLLAPAGVPSVTPWGTPPPTHEPGVYLVSLSPDPEAAVGHAVPPVSTAALEGWITRVPSMTLDGERPTASALAEFLGRYWLPGEPILYIGKATSLNARLRQFDRHGLGDRRPHKGGHWLKTLGTLEALHIHWLATETVSHAGDLERDLLTRFAEAARGSRPGLDLVLPFANMVLPPCTRKQNILRRQVR